jgi:hypothetical protein
MLKIASAVPALARGDEVGHERHVRVERNVEDEPVHRQDGEHRRERRVAREVEQRGRGQPSAGDEVGAPPAQRGTRPVGEGADERLDEGAGERALLAEQADGPGGDLRVALQVEAGRQIEDVEHHVRAEAAAAVDEHLRKGERARGCATPLIAGVRHAHGHHTGSAHPSG